MTIPNLLAEVQLPGPPFPSLLQRAVLPVEVPAQIFDQWCWAAVTAGIEAFLEVESPRSQCRIVNDVLGVNVCCGPEQTANVGVCNVPRTPQEALRELFLERVDTLDGGATFAFVQREIVGRGLPVLVNVTLGEERVGHLVVISGFVRRGPIIELIVWDPYREAEIDEPNTVPIQRLRNGYYGRWRASYRLRRPNPTQ